MHFIHKAFKRALFCFVLFVYFGRRFSFPFCLFVSLITLRAPRISQFLCTFLILFFGSAGLNESIIDANLAMQCQYGIKYYQSTITTAIRNLSFTLRNFPFFL